MKLGRAWYLWSEFSGKNLLGVRGQHVMVFGLGLGLHLVGAFIFLVGSEIAEFGEIPIASKSTRFDEWICSKEILMFLRNFEIIFAHLNF